MSARIGGSTGGFDAAKLALIPCPNLRTLVNEGYLTPDANGLVDLAQLDVALQKIGVEGLPKTALVKGAQKATAESVSKQFGELAQKKFNVLQLTGSTLDHAGDTRILRGGFDPKRLDWLLSFANPQGRLGVEEMSRAQKEARNDEPTDLRAKLLGVAELTALVKVYGTPDANGKKSLDVEGVKSLYRDSKFPAEWRARLEQSEKLGAVSPQKTGLFRLIGGIVEMAFRQLGTHTGRATEGLNVALDRDRPLDQSSALGLSQGMCPAGPPSSMSKKESLESHG